MPIALATRARFGQHTRPDNHLRLVPTPPPGGTRPDAIAYRGGVEVMGFVISAGQRHRREQPWEQPTMMVRWACSRAVPIVVGPILRMAGRHNRLSRCGVSRPRPRAV